MQKSGSTPYGAITTTTPTGRKDSKKDIDFIVMAHRPTYMATASAAFPRDLMKKVQKALSMEGTKFIHVHAPCPTGWRYSTEKSVEIGKLAVKTGMWYLYEYQDGKVTLSAPTSAALKKPTPVEEYVKMQGRFKGVDLAGLQHEIEAGAARIRGLVQ